MQITRRRRSGPHIGISLALLTSILLLAAPQAHALSCARALRPHFREATPRNTRIWIPTFATIPVHHRITDLQGRELPFTETRMLMEGSEIRVLKPDELLAYPGAYRVVECVEAATQRCEVLTEFTTVDEVDTEPPGSFDASAPELIVEDDEDYGPTRLISYPLPPGALAAIARSGTSTASPFASDSALYGLSLGYYASFGRAPCGARSSPPAADFRFGLLDLAGNFGGWSEPIRVVVPTSVFAGVKPEEGDGGCALTTRREGALGWLLLLGALALLRWRPAQPRSLRTNSMKARSAGGCRSRRPSGPCR